jgi:hypothetical protein
MVWRTLGLILMLAATEAHAGASALSGDEIKETVAGAVVAVDTPLGATLPIHYGNDICWGQRRTAAPGGSRPIGCARNGGDGLTVPCTACA